MKFSESLKKNIEKVDYRVLDKILKTGIYKYHYKKQDENTKKHIGFIIGENYNVPDEILSNDNQNVDLYSAITYLWKGVQEQQELIEQLQNEIQELKGEKNSEKD